MARLVTLIAVCGVSLPRLGAAQTEPAVPPATSEKAEIPSAATTTTTPSTEAPAEEAPARPPTHLGVGYKIGNGIGFVGGDIVIGPVPHLALDLQFNYLSADASSGTATGFGFAPEVILYLFDPGTHTPYLSLGYVYAAVSLENVTAAANGGFLNLGYEWKWAPGLCLQLGGGVGYLDKVSATDGTTTITRNGGVHANIEAGLRFMFL